MVRMVDSLLGKCWGCGHDLEKWDVKKGDLPVRIEDIEVSPTIIGYNGILMGY